MKTSELIEVFEQYLGNNDQVVRVDIKSVISHLKHLERMENGLKAIAYLSNINKPEKLPTKIHRLATEAVEPYEKECG